jgi:hypothetical protein
LGEFWESGVEVAKRVQHWLDQNFEQEGTEETERGNFFALFAPVNPFRGSSAEEI